MRFGDEPFATATIPGLVVAQLVDGELHVHTREGVTKEFKENFTWGSIGLYARTMAAFANNRGGYIFFGVTDKPRRAVGLTESAQEAFDNLDQAKLTENLNELFSPALQWEIGLIEVEGVTLGAIYTFESREKPIVARKSYSQQNAKLLESDIVYRYNSRTERAKYPELRNILDESRRNDQRAMMSHIEELVRAGASNAAVLNFESSTLQGPTGQRVLIDEGLLDKISFIREGEFSEVAGAPTLKVVGEMQPAKTLAVGPERVVKGVLSTEDVLSDFLERARVPNPLEYVRQVATGSISVLPIHYYGSLARRPGSQLVEFVESVATRSVAKRKVLERLNNHDAMRAPVPTTSTQHASTVARREFYLRLMSEHPDAISVDNADSSARLVEAMKSLDDKRIAEVATELLALLKREFDKYYSTHAKFAEALRRATCRIDYALYADESATD